MNSETAIVVGIVVALVVVLSVATVFSGSLDQVGSSLFGENQEGSGFFQPDQRDDYSTDDDYSFPTQDDSSSGTGG